MKNIIACRTGKWAPRTSVGASSKRDNPKTRTAEVYRHRRVGNLFVHLLVQTLHGDIFVKQSGYNLRSLADAVRAWKTEKLCVEEDTEALKNKEAILISEIELLLQSYHGR